MAGLARDRFTRRRQAGHGPAKARRLTHGEWISWRVTPIWAVRTATALRVSRGEIAGSLARAEPAGPAGIWHVGPEIQGAQTAARRVRSFGRVQLPAVRQLVAASLLSSNADRADRSCDRATR
jgi:hypothetical protein